MKRTNRFIGALVAFALAFSSLLACNVVAYADSEEPSYKNIVLDAKELYVMDEKDTTAKSGTALLNTYVMRQIVDGSGNYNGTGSSALFRTNAYQDGTYGYYINNDILRLTPDAGYQITQIRVSFSNKTTDTFTSKYTFKVDNWKDKYNGFDAASVTKTATREEECKNGWKQAEYDYVINNIPAYTAAVVLEGSYFTRIEFTEQKLASYDVVPKQGVTDATITLNGMNNYGYYYPQKKDGTSYVLVDTDASGVKGIKPQMLYFAATGNVSEYLKVYVGDNTDSLIETTIYSGPSTDKINNNGANLYYVPVNSKRYVKFVFTAQEWQKLVGKIGWGYPAPVLGQANNDNGSVTLNLNSGLKSDLNGTALINVTSSNNTFESASVAQIDTMSGNDYTVTPAEGKSNSVLIWDLNDLTPLCGKIEVK